MDLSNILENGVLGIIGACVFIIYKLVSNKYPTINGGGHTKRAADTLEKQLEVAIATNKKLDKMHTAQTELVEAHTDQYARRPDGTWKWHNNPDREEEIKETHNIVKGINRKVDGIQETLSN